MSESSLPETTTLRRMKRSRTLQVTSLMATVSFSMAACGAPQPSIPVAEPDPALAYTSTAECKADSVSLTSIERPMA